MTLEEAHRRMVYRLGEILDPTADNQSIQAIRNQFTRLLINQELLTSEEVVTKEMVDIFDLLLKRNLIDYGNYELILDMFTEIQFLVGVEIIKDCQQYMASIQQVYGAGIYSKPPSSYLSKLKYIKSINSNKEKEEISMMYLVLLSIIY